MKKLLSLILALTMVFSFCCFFVSADGEEPEAYLWLTADESFAPSIQFVIPGERFFDADYRIITHACFENCEGEGDAYVNYYVYSKDATGTGDFDHLIQFKDFASHKTAGEGWKDLEFTFNPCTGSYGSFEGKTVDASEIGFVTVGIGFWQATGTVKCSEVRLNKDREVVWAKSFGGKFDPENDEQVIFSALGTEGTNWGIVKPELIDNGNIALDADIEVAVNSNTYNACLNDGAAYGSPAYNGNWFAFTKAAPQEVIDGVNCYVGELVYDFGEAKWWNTVRANMWEESGSGIGRAKAIKVLYSDDKENWTEAGELTLGEGAVYWAEGEFDAISSRYVKVQFIWVVNNVVSFIMTNEVEVIGCEEPADEGFDGDANGDGVVNSKDAIYLLRAILNPASYPISFSGDVNGDGIATTADAIYLLRNIFFPEKYPIKQAPAYPEGTNIAEGKSYTTGGDYTLRLSNGVPDGYSDPDLVKLTDGIKDTTGGTGNVAAFNGTNADIIINLGSVGKITGIITDLQGNNWGIPKPFGYTVNFAVSADGETWTDLGAGYQKVVLEQESGWNFADFYTVCDVEAQYVKVNYVTPADYTGTHIWPSEIQVLGEAGEVEPEVLPIVITGDEGIAEVAPDAIKKLYDGVFADDAAAFSDERLMNINWDAAFNYNTPTENGSKQAVIVYDLGELTGITGVKIGAFKDRNSYVDFPGVAIYLSNDGETYVRAADGTWTSSIDGLVATTERGDGFLGSATYTADWSTRATLSAQYVKIVLTLNDPFAFLSEIAILTDYVADGALEENIDHAVDVVKLNGVNVAIIDGIATVLTSEAGEISLEADATGDYKSARSGVITVAKWDAEKGGYVVTFNEVNPWGPLNDGSGKSGNYRTGTLTIAEDEIGVFTVSSGTIKNAGAGDKWVMWHIEVGDVLYVYDDVIAINHKIDGADSRCFVPKPIQPEEKAALPEGAIALDRAGFEYTAGLAEVLYSAEETTIVELTGKDLNAFAVAIVDAETMKVTWFGNTTGRPDGVKSDVVVPANSYLFIVHMDKAADFAAYTPEIGAEIKVYNVNLEAIADLEAAAVLTDAGFTYENPVITIDVDTTGWTYVDGVKNGVWQNTSDPVGAYYYNVDVVDGKYVVEVVFDGELSGTDASYGNGNGTNVRLWFHTAKNAAETAQLTYNAFMDIAYTPDGLIDTLKTNGTADGNSGVLYEGDKVYTIESVIPTAKDGLYVKVVFDSIPNCLVNEDLDVIITVSNKPGDKANNALYSNNQLKPYSEPWNRRESVNFYPIPYTNVAANATMKVVGGAVEGDPIEAGDPAQNKYKTSLNDGVASDAKTYTNDWFAFYYKADALDKCNAATGSIGELEGNLGTVIADLGEATTWNQVKVNVWAAQTSGIGGPIAIEVYSSDDGENWTDVGALKLGEDKTVYMAVGNFADITSKYVKVEVLWTNGVYCFINEIEINNVGAAPEAEDDEVAFDFGETAVDVKVNEPVGGETVRIFKPGYLLSEGNLKWSINVVVTKAGEDTYSVVSVAAGSGETPDITLAEDQLIVAVHSDGVGQNVAGKNAALALKAGDILRITGLEPESAEDQATVELLK